MLYLISNPSPGANVISLESTWNRFGCAMNTPFIFRSRGPRVDQARAFLHVVFDLQSFAGRECNFSRIDLESLRLCNEHPLHLPISRSTSRPGPRLSSCCI